MAHGRPCPMSHDEIFGFSPITDGHQWQQSLPGGLSGIRSKYRSALRRTHGGIRFPEQIKESGCILLCQEGKELSLIDGRGSEE